MTKPNITEWLKIKMYFHFFMLCYALAFIYNKESAINLGNMKRGRRLTEYTDLTLTQDRNARD